MWLHAERGGSGEPVVLVDVREADEWQRGHLPGAIHLSNGVIERDIEDLVRRADRDDYDPYLLPGDSLACYDSTITNIGEVGRVVGQLAL